MTNDEGVALEYTEKDWDALTKDKKMGELTVFAPLFEKVFNIPVHTAFYDSKFFANHWMNDHCAPSGVLRVINVGDKVSWLHESSHAMLVQFNNALPEEANNAGHVEPMIFAPRFMATGVLHPMNTGVATVWYPFIPMPGIDTFITPFYQGWMRINKGKSTYSPAHTHAHTHQHTDTHILKLTHSCLGFCFFDCQIPLPFVDNPVIPFLHQHQDRLF